jgi:hypothetical protein
LSILIAFSAADVDDVDDDFFSVDGAGCDAHIRADARW